MYVKLTELACGRCGIVFGVPDYFAKEIRESKVTFYCPNGHPRVYTESVTEKLRQELDDAHERATSNYRAYLDAKEQLDRCKNGSRRKAAK